jgi:hypothetical protein
MTDEAAWPFAQHVCGTVYTGLLDASADAVLVAVSRPERFMDARETLGPLVYHRLIRRMRASPPANSPTANVCRAMAARSNSTVPAVAD